MATASLPFIETINCQASRNSSINSILSKGSEYLSTPSTEIALHHPMVGISPSITQPRRTASLARRRHDEALRSKELRRSQCHSDWQGSTDVNVARQDRKQSTSKESGRRRILNFLQRGFNPKWTKSINKDDRKKSTDCHPASEECLNDLLGCLDVQPSPVDGVRILGEQIYLPSQLLNSYHIIASPDQRRQTLSLSLMQRPSQIFPIDASLLNSIYRHCFQVLSYPKPDSAPLRPDGLDRDVIADSGVSQFTSRKSVAQDDVTFGSYTTRYSEQFNVHTYACATAMERSRWILFLKRLVRPTRDNERRRENCLHVWIQEVKGLTGRHRYHCEILLDGKVCARTTSKRLTDMLFWGEEFDLSGLADFTTLSVELWLDSDVEGPSNASIGSTNVSNHRDALPSTTFHEQRHSTGVSFPIRKTMMACAGGGVNAATSEDSQVQAQSGFHEASLCEDRMNNINKGIEGSDGVPGCGGGGSGGKSTNRRGKMRHHMKRARKSVLIASVNIPASKFGSVADVENWYPVVVHEVGGRRQKYSDSSEVTGGKINRSIKHQSSVTSPIQLRIKIRYRSVCVLPLGNYARLQAHLSAFQSPHTPLKESSHTRNPLPTDVTVLLSNLDQWLNVKAKAELAGSVVALQQALGQASEFLAVLILHEVYKQDDSNMVLRGNSIATKATEIYLRLVGEDYLSMILDDFVRTVIAGCRSPSQSEQPGKPVRLSRQTSSNTTSEKDVLTFMDCEVDTSKLQSSSQLVRNQANLMCLVQMVWKRILSSEPYFPNQLRLTFAAVRQHLDTAFPVSNSSNPHQATLTEHVISACLFLRYICPAILSPSLFGLAPEFPSDPKVLRTFTLVAKAIQSLANFSLFAGSKEVYMTFMNQFVMEQLPAMRHFLYAISSPSTTTPRSSNVSRADGSNSYATGDGSRVFTSHSHHGGFASMTVNGDVESVTCPFTQHDFTGNASSMLVRSTSGLPTITPQTSPSSITRRPRTADGLVGLSSELTDQPQRVREPILLPTLHVPTHTQFQNTSITGDHIDLALCLALCHLQLSEVIAKIPPEKPVPFVAELKDILDEIDFFMTSGIDPNPNWWHTLMSPKPHEAHTNGDGSVIHSNILVEQNSLPVCPGPTQVTTVQVRHSDAVPYTRPSATKITVVASSQTATLGDYDEWQRKSVDNSCTPKRSSPVGRLVANGDRDTGLPVFIIPTRTNNVSTNISSSNHQISRHLSPVDNHENIDPTTSDLLPVAPLKVERTRGIKPKTQQLPLHPSSVKNEEKIVNVTVSTETQEPTSDEIVSEVSNLWSISPGPTSPAPTYSMMCSSERYPQPGLRAARDVSNNLSLVYVTQYNSSGYQSLGSHENGGYSLPNRVGDLSRVENASFVPTTSPVALAMNNPLYELHTTATTSSIASSHSGSAHSSPSKCSGSPLNPIVQAVPSRSKSFTNHEFSRRHTYVNLTANGSTEALLSSIRNKPIRAADVSLESSPEQVVKSPLMDRSYTLVGNRDDTELVHPNAASRLECAPSANRSQPVGPVELRAYGSSGEGAGRMTTTLHAYLEGYNIKPLSVGTDSVRSAGYPLTRRTVLKEHEMPTTIPAHIRDELDASQARLAEAQARLLANEAERIQLLREWHNELMRQSQLVNRGGYQTTTSDDSTEAGRVAWTSSHDARSSESRTRVATGLEGDPSVGRSYKTVDTTETPSSTMGRPYRPGHSAQPRMGASVIGATAALNCPIPPPDSGQSTLPRGYMTVRKQPADSRTSESTTGAVPDRVVIARSPSSPGLIGSFVAPNAVRSVELYDPSHLTETDDDFDPLPSHGTFASGQYSD